MKDHQEHIIHNPIIPGFYPDPSVVRVGEDFYLVNSSFELCPGIPVFHSRDLAHWEQLCYALTPENKFHVTANMGTGGIMAPTIRYFEGVFYIVCANFADQGNFYIEAVNPAGPWSKPKWITGIPDIDCSLFFDSDGTSYLVSPGDDPKEDNGRGFFIVSYDLKQNRITGTRKKIWNSAMRNAWAPEAPHLYHIGDYYYLMTAEGGTEHYHSVVIARSRVIDGFYEGYPGNPVLTHRNLGWNYPIENVGHADLFDTPKGKWYAVALGTRCIDGQHMNLGRETYICPVTWERGWPVFSPESGKMEECYPADNDLPWTEYKKTAELDDFDTDNNRIIKDIQDLAPDWEFWGTPYQDFWKIEKSSLYLKCLKRPFAEPLKGFNIGETDTRKDHCVSFMGKRQRYINFEVSVCMHFKAEKSEAAGLVIQQACNHQFRVEQYHEDERQKLRLIQLTTEQSGLPFLPGYEAKTNRRILSEVAIPEKEDSLILQVKAVRQTYQFSYGCHEDHMQILYADADASAINPEEVGGMIGTMIGMFATSNGNESNNEAAFDWFCMKDIGGTNL